MTFQDINQVELAFAAWGKVFTHDCMKKDRGQHDKWLTRKMLHVDRVATRTKHRLKCLHLNIANR